MSTPFPIVHQWHGGKKIYQAPEIHTEEGPFDAFLFTSQLEFLSSPLPPMITRGGPQSRTSVSDSHMFARKAWPNSWVSGKTKTWTDDRWSKCFRPNSQLYLKACFSLTQDSAFVLGNNAT
eukprot:TRINITY_DN49876_c0_g1_i1.p1 TRINITY_DN49876_c0_g1~~TRINITY_DN49876_c0_g1_i1.p1  ORF type:complete len:121 (-),score=9.89 TRINITY_DN49876_c0_g1_i1:454-816(-)